MRKAIGILFLCFGVSLGIAALFLHKILWAGVRTQTITKTITVDKDVTGAAAEDIKKDDTGKTGPVLIEYRYYTIDKTCEKKDSHGESCVSTGVYQVRDSENKIWMMKFCEPVPDLRYRGAYDITYMKGGKECPQFVNAKPIQEPR